jgi:hypothetical protein
MKISKYLLALFPALVCTASFANDARSYNLMPSNSTVIESQYSNIDTDVTKSNGIKLKVNTQTAYLRYLKYFNINGNLAGAYILLPYAQQEISVSAPFNISSKTQDFGDIRVLLAVGLHNMPALGLDEFKKHNPNGLLSSCSLSLTLPTGNYKPTSLTNTSGNRYVAKPECSLSYINNKFEAEIYSGLSAYSDNTQYSGVSSLSQKNIYHTELHLSYTLTPNVWIGADLIYLNGGETSINNISQKDGLDNTSVGLITSFKLSSSSYVKLIAQKLINAPDFAPKNTAVGITYQYVY